MRLPEKAATSGCWPQSFMLWRFRSVRATCGCLIVARIHDIKVQIGTLQMLMHYANVLTAVVSYLLVICVQHAKDLPMAPVAGLALSITPCIWQKDCATYSLLDHLLQALQTPPGMSHNTHSWLSASRRKNRSDQLR